MPAKQVFTDEQIDILIGVVRRHLKRFRTQVELAKALGITQPSLSSMLAGKWRPGLTTARHIASLEMLDLEDLLPDWNPAPPSLKPHAQSHAMPNLDKCLLWHEDEQRWGAWTVAAAKAGIYGTTDYAKAEWVARLDVLEKALARARKVTS